MNTKKTLVAVIAALLVAATLPCFAKGNVVTKWKWSDGRDTLFFTFYSDKTAEMLMLDADGDVTDQVELTYAGDTTKNGKITAVAPNGRATIGEIVEDTLVILDAAFTRVKK